MSGIEKSYGWCQSCGALVVSSLKYSKCLKCGGKVKTFCIDMELFTLKQQRDDLLEACEPFARLADMIPKPNAPDPQWRKFNTAIRALPLDRYREAKAAIANCDA